jgi:hypothetical protein
MVPRQACKHAISEENPRHLFQPEAEWLGVAGRSFDLAKNPSALPLFYGSRAARLIQRTAVLTTGRTLICRHTVCGKGMTGLQKLIENRPLK